MNDGDIEMSTFVSDLNSLQIRIFDSPLIDKDGATRLSVLNTGCNRMVSPIGSDFHRNCLGGIWNLAVANHTKFHRLLMTSGLDDQEHPCGLIACATSVESTRFALLT